MKRLIYPVVGLALMFVACDDFLDVEAPSGFDTDYVFSNDVDAEKAILGVYAEFAQDAYTSRMSNVWMQNTDIEVTAPSANPDGSRRDIWSLQGGLLTGFSDIYKAWNSNYLAIDRANQCIEGIVASPSAGTEAMNQLLGEAYCLRAYRYFLMCNFWGDVPYFIAAAKAGMDFDVPKTDKNVIYSGCIQDLVKCEPKMKFADESSLGIERMNREFAIGMIARLSLFRAGYGMTKSGTMKRADDYLDVANDPSLAVAYISSDGTAKVARTSADYYELAKEYCLKLISLRGRSLNPDFGLVFQNESKWLKPINDDVLFEVGFGFANGGGDVGWCIGIPVSSSSKGTTTVQVGFSPTYYFSFDDSDFRRDVTVSLINYIGDNDQKVNSVTGLAVGKWNRLLVPNAPGSSSSKGTGINWPLMRYSDILLMLAEAENELNGPTGLATQALARVRERAFPAVLHSLKVDGYVAQLGSKDAFFNAIVNERAWEFGGECMRKFDLVRWNNFGQKIVETKIMLDNIGKASWGLELENPEVAKYTNIAPTIYYQKKSGQIVFYNTKYKPEVAPSPVVPYDDLGKAGNEEAYASQSWGKGLYQELKDANNQIIGFASSNFTQWCWRGYTDATGLSAVPYLLPITTTTLGATTQLSNEGYGHVTSAN